MNFKLFTEEYDFDLWLESEKYGRKVVDKEHKVKLLADDIDRDLYRRYSSQYSNKMIPAKLIAARYAYLKPDTQELAERSGVYFKNVDMQQDRSPGVLIINTKGQAHETIVDTYIKKLKERLENYKVDGKTINIVPYIKRFGGNGAIGITGSSGVTPARLGLEDPAKAGWKVGYHWSGQATTKLSKEEEKHANKKGAIDSTNVPEAEKIRVKKLTAGGNRLVDEILFNPTTMETEITNSAGNPMTNKEVLALAKRYIRKYINRNEDPDDMLAAFAFQIRKNHGAFEKYQSGEQLIAALVKNAILDVREDMGVGRKEGDVQHGKKNALRTRSIEGQGGEDQEKTQVTQPTAADLKRRLDISKPEITSSATREDVPEEPETHNIRTYKTKHKSADEEADEKLRKDLDKTYGQPQATMPKNDIERASSADLAARKRQFLDKIRSMSGYQTNKSPLSDRLRQKFKVA